MIPILEKRFASLPTADWLERLKAADIPAAPIQTVAEALNDEQTIARSLIVELEHPTLKQVRSIAIRLQEQPIVYRLPPPLLGEHNREILRELKITDGEVEELLQTACAQL